MYKFSVTNLPNTRIPSLSFPTPCICTKNSVLIRLALSLSVSDREEHRESTSSIKMMLGLCCRASSNKFLTNFSDSPSHLETRSEEDTEKNVELLASVATAFARYDFPVPGGYKKKIIGLLLKAHLKLKQTINLLQKAKFPSKGYVFQ